MSQNSKTAKMVLGRYYRVLYSMQTGPFKTSRSEYWKNITVGLYPKQNFVVDTFTRCQAKLSKMPFSNVDSYRPYIAL